MARMIHTRGDLAEYGIACVTGEACLFSARTLVDLDARGRRIVADLLGLTALADDWPFPPSWRGDGGARWSAMIPHGLFADLSVWCLLDAGCAYVLRTRNGACFGFRADEQDRFLETCDVYREMGHIERTFTRVPGQPGIGTRSTHAASGRTA